MNLNRSQKRRIAALIKKQKLTPEEALEIVMREANSDINSPSHDANDVKGSQRNVTTFIRKSN